MNAGPEPSGTRYHSLDQWRGFAALWVMVFHAVEVWLNLTPGLLPGWLGTFCNHGWLGANLFFVISGYCIAERCAREYRARGTVRSFLADRLLRIYPPYWVALLGVILLNVAATLVNDAAFKPGNPLPDGGQGWLLAFGALEYWARVPDYLLVAWTLSFEVGFYFLAALCLGLASGTRRPWAGWALGGLLVVAGLSPVRMLLPLLALWPQFALGGIVWLLLHAVPSTGARLGVASGLFSIVAVAGWHLAPGGGFSLVFVCGCAFLLLVLYPLDRRIAAAPALRWLGWCGTFSYSLYLLHAPIVGKFRNLLGRRWPADEPSSLWVPAVGCGLAVLVSWGFFQLIERRTERWRRTYLHRPAVS